MVNSKKKGNGFELECLHMWQDIFPEACTARFGDRSADAKGHDIINCEQFKIQCKRNRKYANPNKIEEVQIEDGEVPILMTRGDNKKTMVVLPADEFFKILKGYHGM